jgi:predicted short-subunit dehydrogenase-like oxidoreductase (DUF2520 family)
VPVRLAVVGPGRVGTALGRRWAEAGVDLLGFVGRTAASAAAAVAFCGRGRVLALADLARAHAVVLAVPDPLLPEVVRAAAAAAPGRACSLWLHTSGRHDLSVLEPLRAASVRLGALHPVAPFPDVATGLQQMAGRPAVLLGEPRALRLLARLARMLGMQPLESRGGDRALYHAACALAANGLTALCAAVERAFAAAAALAPDDARAVAQALMAAALQATRDRGAAAALSGPVARGDAATVAVHRRALRGVANELDDAYRALMVQALALAEQRGLSAAAAAAVRQALAGGAGR